MSGDREAVESPRALAKRAATLYDDLRAGVSSEPVESRSRLLHSMLGDLAHAVLVEPETPTTDAGGASLTDAEAVDWDAIPDFMWRSLAETLIKGTRWEEWRSNGWGWQGDRITELATELRRSVPVSEVAQKRILGGAGAGGEDEGAGEVERLRAAIKAALRKHGYSDCRDRWSGGCDCWRAGLRAVLDETKP